MIEILKQETRRTIPKSIIKSPHSQLGGGVRITNLFGTGSGIFPFLRMM